MSPQNAIAILLTIAVSCNVQLSTGAPHKRESFGPTATMGSMVANEPTCFEFGLPYCQSFSAGYKYASFPNPRQGSLEDIKSQYGPYATYQSDAIREFQHFIPLMNKECSNKLGTLLCFLYFPFCNSNSSNAVTIRPCRSLCEEVTRDCATALEEVWLEGQNISGVTWESLPHFNCSHFEFQGSKVYTESNCANNTQAPWTVTPTIVDEEDDFTFPEEETPEKTTEEATEETTAAATTEEITCPPYAGKCSNCRIRSGFNAKTFVRNKEYNFAVEATDVSFTTQNCKHALQFTVEESHHIRSSKDCSAADGIEAGSKIVCVGSDVSCENCFQHEKLDLSGKSYLIAGVAVLEDDGNTVYQCEGTSSMIHHLEEDKTDAIALALGKGNDGADQKCL